MGFEIGRAFSGGAEWICSLNGLFGILRNPVFTALLITVITMIIIFVVFKPQMPREGRWRQIAKGGIWLMFVISMVVFMHYYALDRHLKQNYSQKGVRDVVGSINHAAEYGSGYKVYPVKGRESFGGGSPFYRESNVGDDISDEDEEDLLEEIADDEGAAFEGGSRDRHAKNRSMFPDVTDIVLPSTRTPGLKTRRR